jgi:hypothetical protein
MVFTEGTILYHTAAQNQTRDTIVQQVKDKHPSIYDFTSYLPIGESPKKLAEWDNQGHQILYMTSRTKPNEIQAIRDVLAKQYFPEGALLHRSSDENYAQVVARNLPDVIIEDDCESIGDLSMTVYAELDSNLKAKITSILVREFAGIDHLPDVLTDIA